ncbi:MAG: hypothetical protein ACJ798_00870 [Phenylobacterium sp.]
MSHYILVFEWPAASRISAQTRRIEAAGPEEAKAQAAALYASGRFPQGPPPGYVILNRSGATIFRYPDDG